MDKNETPQLFTRTQKVILLVLVSTLVLGLFLVRHRRLAAAAPVTITPGSPEAYRLKIDLNTATWQEIAVLPGIGESKARAIVAERDKNGPFKSAADLSRVPGIGEKRIADLSPYVRAGQGGE